MSRSVELLARLRLCRARAYPRQLFHLIAHAYPEHPPPPRPLSTILGIFTARTWLCTPPLLVDALWVSQRFMRGLLLARRLYLRYALSQGGVYLGELRDDRVCPPPSFPFLAQYRAEVADLLTQILN